MDSFNLQMPFSQEAEMSLLGALLIDKESVASIVEIISVNDFYIKENKEIFETILEMFNLNLSIDFVMLLDQLKLKGYYDENITKRYVMQLLDIVPSVSNVTNYAKIIKEKSLLRELIGVSEEIKDISMTSGDEFKNIMDLAEQRIYDISQNRQTKGFLKIKDVIFDSYQRLRILANDPTAFLGVPTGFSALDKRLIGLNNSDLLLIAARPGMGKTSFALNIAQNVATKTKKDVVIFSLEMSATQLVERMISSEAMVENERLKTGELSDDDWTKIARAASVLSGCNILIDDSSSISVLEMKGKCRRLKNLGLIVIDYLQLMQSGKRSDNRVQEVSEISRSLKIMAKELNVPVICLSQLSRGPESRSDKRPMLSDLRESGAIEQDADVVLFLYRDDYYNKESEKRNICECIISKNRHGETGLIELEWLGQYTRFTTLEWAREDG